MSRHVYKETTATSTTSIVHEYTCLFTHDLKRKAKRWQDGRMRYHAFNGRLMVYDERGSVIGDAHLTSSSQTLEEHEELALDRGAAIVRVGVRTGEKEVDLGELVDKRAREVEKRRREAAEKQQRARPQAPAGDRSFRTSHRPLTTIMQTPGRIGRAAIPRESPFEQRRQQLRQQQQEQADTPSAKRSKTNQSPPSKMGHARSLFGTQLSLSAVPMRSWSQRTRVLQDSTNVRTQAPSSAEKPEDDDVVMLDEHMEPQKQVTHPSLQLPENAPERPSKITNTNDDDLNLHDDAEMPRRTTKSRLGSLRVSRVNRQDSGEIEQQEANVLDVNKQPHKVTLSRPQPPRSAVITIGSSIDSGDEPTKPSKPKPKSSLQVLKEAAASRAYATAKSTAGLRQNLEETSQSVPQGRQESPEPPPPANHGRSKMKSARQNNGLASGSRRETPRDDKITEPAVPRDVQPRTELRIKARKKRRLLVLSEDRSPAEEESISSSDLAHKESLPLAEAQTENFEEWYAKGIVSDGDGDAIQQPSLSPTNKDSSQQDVTEIPTGGFEAEDCLTPRPPSASASSTGRSSTRIEEEKDHAEIAQPKASPAPKDPTPHEEAGHVSDDNSDSDAPRTRRRRRQTKTGMRMPDAPLSTIPDCAYDESQSEDDWDGPAPAATRSKQANKKPASKPKAADKKQANKGPRMSRISKSSKSKEIFGFKIPGDNYIVPDSWVTSIGPMGQDHAAATHGTGPSDAGDRITLEASQKQAAQPTLAIEDKKAVVDEAPRSSGNATTARVVNPATRGRKAASKADAAGRAPQSIVPFDPPPMPVKLVEPNYKQVPKEPASLPGFSKVNGGAWSRHAGDLLGMERPKGRSSAW
ncbi:hypothetical protein ACO1O0_005702 [Amphichorda felina]